MGSTLSVVFAAVKKLDDPNESEKEANDILNSLTSIAEARLNTFYRRVTSPDFDVKKLPISKVLYRSQFFRCGVEKNSSNIADAITGTLDAFVTVDVMKGITAVANASLNYLLDNYVANESSTTTYAVVIGEIGGIARIDADFYSYRFTSTDLQKITQNIVTVSIVISSVDVLSLDENDLKVIVQTCFKDTTKKVQKKILKEIKKEWKEEKDEAAKDSKK